MKTRTHFFMSIMTILMVLAISAMQVVPVLADDEVPPPPAATEVVDPAAGGAVPPVEETSSPEAPPTEAIEAPALVEAVPVATGEAVASPEERPMEEPSSSEEPSGEILSQLPENTDVVVLDENGEAVPLVTQKAAEIIAGGDPQWCPVGVTPGSPSCSGAKDSFNGGNAATNLIQWLIDNPQFKAGVIWILRSSSSNPGDPLYVGDFGTEGAAVTLDGSVLSSMSAYALTIQGGWTGTGLTLDTAHPTIFRVPLNIVNWNANVTLSDIAVTSVSGADGLSINTTKDISLTRVDVHNNNAGGYGARLNNTSVGVVTGTGKITITNSHFDQNAGGYGLYVTSKGTITLIDVTAEENVMAGTGAYLDNSTSSLTPGITLTRSTFSGNRFDGLVASSKGLISAIDLTAIGNGKSESSGGGVTLSNLGGIAGVTMTGTNIFTDNYGTGLSVQSKGAITLSNVIANANDGTGYGAYLDNSSSTTFQAITLTGTSQFKYNRLSGLYILSKGLVSLNNITANGNNAGGDAAESGVRIDNCRYDGVLLKCTGSATGGVKLTGTSYFNDNYTTGLSITSSGLLTLNSITATGNGTATSPGYGANLTTINAATAKTITLTGTNFFSDNYSAGLYVTTKGAIAISNLTANDTVHGNGVQLDNSTGAAVGITLSGASFFSNNYANGLHVNSIGILTISTITAAGNGTSGTGYGAYLDNCMNSGSGCTSLAKGITLIGVSEFSGNDDGGLYVSSTGAVKLTSVTASDNTGYGIRVHTTYNNVSVAAVTLSGTNTFNNNTDSAGLYIDTPGIVTLNNLNAAGNGSGVYVSNTDSGASAPRNVTLTGLNTFESNASHGLEIYSFGTITLASVTATGNGTSGSGNGVYLDNSSAATLPRGVTLSGTNTFTSNYSNGLEIHTLGAITTSALIANANGVSGTGSGARLVQETNAIGSVTLNGTNTFNDNYNDGLSISALGVIKINNLRASYNGHALNDNGAELNNAGASNMAVTLTGNVIVNGNYDSGLFVNSAGLISVINIIANNNQRGNGAYLRNDSGSLSPGVTLTGINLFTGNYNNGLYVSSYGAINLLTTSLTANNNGLLGSSGFGVTLTNVVSTPRVPQIVKLTGTNIFNGNYDGGLRIDTMGAITTSNLTANNNTNGNGVSLTNTGAAAAITLAGKNIFNNNYFSGMNISSLGVITISNIIANVNGVDSLVGYGVYIDNSTDSTPRAVNITGNNTLNGNYNDGLYIASLGTVTVNNLTANYNIHGSGAYIVNNMVGATGNVTLTGFVSTSENFSDGVHIVSKGNISLTKLTSDGNGNDGLYANTTGTITLTCGSLTGNGNDGLDLTTPVLKLTGVFSYGNAALNLNPAGIPPTYTVARTCPLP